MVDHFRQGWSSAGRRFAAALILVPIAAGAAPQDKAKAAPKQADGAAKGTIPANSRPARPARVVTKPTLTSADLDELIRKAIEAAKGPTAQLTTDPEFIRRVYLDVTGKPPTSEQVVAFCREPGTTSKRAKLIDKLLAGEDYARNWARYWCDVIQFHATNTNGNQIRYPALEDWLADALAKNEAWDEVAKGLIVAGGRNDRNGAVNFAICHSADPVELAGEVSRIFLGVQIQCAQCHDHPNDRWKRQQFHEFAAFFAGARARKVENVPGPEVTELVDAPGKPRYTMPDLKDPQKRIAVDPRFFLASEKDAIGAGLTAAERRGLAADYITGQDNPWFARAFVNRVWSVLMGEGFTNPVDDMGPDRECRAPEALEALADQWQKGGYDVRWLFRTILNTKTYQRQVRSTYSHAGRTPFGANCTSRLRADQIADSLASALEPSAGRETGKGQETDEARAKAAEAATRARKALRDSIRNTFGVDPSTPIDQILGSIPQALFMMNSGQVNRGIRSGKGSMLGEILAANPKNNAAALEALYVRVLSRPPSPKELELCGRYIQAVGKRGEAFEDILWSLINSTEFVSRR